MKKGTVIMCLVAAIVLLGFALVQMFKQVNPINNEAPEMAKGSESGPETGGTESGASGQSEIA